MKIEDVLKLVDAGFSKADILALASGTVQQIETQPIQQQTQTDTDEQQKPDPEPKQQESKIPQDVSDDIAAMKAQISAIQRANIQSASQPAGAAKQETAEDVWKDFFERKD